MKPTFCYGCKYLSAELIRGKFYVCELFEIEKMTVPPVACEHYEAPPVPATETTEGTKE